MSEPDVLIIGAGPAGLAASACLRRAGVVHALLERERSVASSWRGHYERLHLHTVKRHSALPFAPWPSSVPQYPSREQVVAYLERYAAEHAVAPQLGVDVQGVRRVQDGFVVQTDGGDRRAAAVVMATGYNRKPFVPPWPGLEGFRGGHIHSSRYRNAVPYRGLRTLVVGCGNSGAEIALDLAEQGVEVSMVVRGPVHVVPRDLFGRPIQSTTIMMSHLPMALRDALSGATMRLAVGDLSRWGIVRPRLGLSRSIERHGRIPMLDIGTIDMIKRGRIRVRPGVRALTPDGVVFDDGKTEPYDALIFCTGFRSGLHDLVEGFDAIADGRGLPPRAGQGGAIPGLHFIGFRIPATGALREIALEAPRVAAAIVSGLQARKTAATRAGKAA